MEQSKQQTMKASDFMFKEISKLIPDEIWEDDKFVEKIHKIYKEAVELEKKQIIKANRDGVDMAIDDKEWQTGLQYYNETYGDETK
jgi:hypothetical protein